VTTSTPERVEPRGQVALVDLLDRLLGAGVVLAGDVTISLAGVDLVQVRLHALITSVRAEMRAAPLLGNAPAGPAEGGTDDG
jgi:hypothetical protein